jgi:NAD(P)-dependent dehydrogenase (short-subunit alcohol dehydrogenase family)
MDLKIAGKKAVVTGGTAGIGYAIAEALAREGARVFLTGRTKESTDKAVKAIKSACSRGDVNGVVADLGTLAGAQTLFEEVPAVDILVNNLGIYEAKSFESITDEDWLRLFEVNVLSGIRTARTYLPKMLAQNDGRIIFISSESGLMVPSDMIHYGTTKTAQLAISRGLAETTKGSGVTVNTVMPGPTRSAGIVEFMRSVSSAPDLTDAEVESEFFKVHRASSLLQRLIYADEIANLVTYLASPLSSATNGAALRAEGGLLRSIG